MDKNQLRRVTSITSSAATAHLTMDYLSQLSLDELKSQEYTLINFEYAVANKGKYFPVELAALKFSLTGGILDVYHVFVDPKPLPPGCNAEAKAHSTETHLIPVFGFDQFEDDYGGMLVVIDEMGGNFPGFIFGVGSTSTVSALPGSKESTFAETNGCLTQLLEMGRNPVQFNAKLFSAEKLAILLVQKFGICDSAAAPKLITRYLERTKHDFYPGIRCAYHEEVDCLRCARAAVFRFYFNIIELLFESRGCVIDVRLMNIPDRLKTSKLTASVALASLKTKRNLSQVDAKNHNIGKGFGKTAMATGRAGTSQDNKQDWRNQLSKRTSSPLMQDKIVAQGSSQIAHLLSWNAGNLERMATPSEALESEGGTETDTERTITPRVEVSLEASGTSAANLQTEADPIITESFVNKEFGSFMDTSASDRPIYGSRNPSIASLNSFECTEIYEQGDAEILEKLSEQLSFARPPTMIEHRDTGSAPSSSTIKFTVGAPDANQVPLPPDEWLPASKYFSSMRNEYY